MAHHRSKPRTWYVVANGAYGRILMQEAPGLPLRPASGEALTTDHRPTRDIGSDRPGRAHERPGGGRHAMEPRVDWHREDQRNFARRLTGIIDEAAGKNAFDSLVLVAPPQALGDLRAALGDLASACVTCEIAKDLTQVPENKLLSRLGLPQTH